MAIRDLYFKRKMRERGEVPQVMQQEDIPLSLRTQFVMIWKEMQRGLTATNRPQLIVEARKIWCRELGVTHLMDAEYSPECDVIECIGEGTTEQVLTAIELLLTLYDEESRERRSPNAWKHLEEAVSELNQRFLWHGVGYQFEHGKIISVKNRLLHQEAVEPALVVLSEPRFAAAAAEFMSAYEHYRHGNLEEALTNACKSFESVLKVICEGRQWTYPVNATAQPLINTVLSHALLPTWMQEHLSGLRQILVSGVPTPRNKLGGHGDGSTPVKVPPYFVPYVLHLTASNIVMLADADRELG